MKQLILILLILFSVKLLNAQSIIVTDNKTDKPLSLVNVYSSATGTSAITNAKGQVSLQLFENADSLSFTLMGYEYVTLTMEQIKLMNFTIKMTEKSYTLGEVLVLGRNQNHAMPNTIGKVDMLGFSDFRRNNDMFLDKALNLVPGVKMEVRSATSQSHILIRGIGGKSRFGLRDIKVYYDGIPITDADGTTALNDIDFTSLGKTEIIKGSSAGLYGSSIGGVINLFSKRARYQEKDFNQYVTFGSFGLLTTTTNFRAGTDRVNFYTNYSYQNLDGFREHSHSKKEFVTFGGDFFISNVQTLSLLVNYAHVNDEFAGEIDSLDYNDNPTVANPSYPLKNIGINSNSFLLGVSHIYKISSIFENTSSIFMGQGQSQSPIEPFFNRLSLSKVGARSVFSVNADLGITKSNFAFGGEVIRNFNVEKHYAFSPFNSNNVGAINSDKEFDLKQFNLFAQAMLDFNESFSLTLSSGFSWSNYFIKDNLKSGNIDLTNEMNLDAVFTPGVLLNYSVNQDVSLYAQVSTGYSPPSVSELSLSDGSVNTSLNPEKSLNFEIGSNGNLMDNKFHYEVSLFYLKIKDSFISQTANGFTQFVNAGSSDNKGLEALASYKLVDNQDEFINLIRPFVSYSYNNFKFVDYKIAANDFSGNEFTGIAPNLLNAGLDVTTSPGLYFYATYNFVDKRPLLDNNTKYDAAYSVIDMKLGLRKRFQKEFTLQFYVGVNNLTDERYSPTIAINQGSKSSRGLPVYYNPAPGRNYYAAFNFEYHF
ncbi:MAG: TonB-dependent receptor [Ignavibacteriota bacterium]